MLWKQRWERFIWTRELGKVQRARGLRPDLEGRAGLGRRRALRARGRCERWRGGRGHGQALEQIGRLSVKGCSTGRGPERSRVPTWVARPRGAVKSRSGGTYRVETQSVLRKWFLMQRWPRRVGTGGLLRGSLATFRSGAARLPRVLWGLQERSQHCPLKAAVGRRRRGTKERLCVSWVGQGRHCQPACPSSCPGLSVLRACLGSLSYSSFFPAGVRGRNTAESGALALTQGLTLQTARLKTAGLRVTDGLPAHLGEGTHSDQEVEDSE